MQKRIIQAGLIGMNQDVINPKINTQNAYEIKNFRINSTGNSNGIELTTEKGTKLVQLKYEYTEDIDSSLYDVTYDSVGNMLKQYKIPVPGALPIRPFVNKSQFDILGYCVLNEYIVLFVSANTQQGSSKSGTNCILRLRYDSVHQNILFCKVLYYGKLNIMRNVECVPYMESVDIQKVYWIDGHNYPRVINIKRQYAFQTDLQGTTVYEDGYLDYGVNDDPFSFYQKISQGDYNNISVNKSYVGGLFYAGVIQYAFSFYNKNAQETPVVYTTPLNYVSHSDRGEAPNKQLGCAFNIEVKVNPEDHDNFEYVRIYSIYRSSINGDTVVKVIKDTKLDNFTGYVQNPNYDSTDPTSQEYIPYDPSDPMQIEFYGMEFIDTNEQGYDFDAYRILVNSDHIVPNAIGYKDQKMFLGNYSVQRNLESDDRFKNGLSIFWDNAEKKIITSNVDDEYYAYDPQLEYDSQHHKTFKYGEYYKLGLQFKDKYGNWSSPYVIGIYKNDLTPISYQYGMYNYVQLPYATMFDDISYIYYLIYNNPYGYENKDYVSVRPVVSFPTISERSVLCQGIINPTVFNLTQRLDKTTHSQNSWFFRPYPYQYDYQDQHLHWEGNSSYKDIHDGITQQNGAVVQFMHNNPLFPNDDIGCEIQGMYFDDGAEGDSFLDFVLQLITYIKYNGLLGGATGPETWKVLSEVTYQSSLNKSVSGTTPFYLETDNLNALAIDEDDYTQYVTLPDVNQYVDDIDGYEDYKYSVNFYCKYNIEYDYSDNRSGYVTARKYKVVINKYNQGGTFISSWNYSSSKKMTHYVIQSSASPQAGTTSFQASKRPLLSAYDLYMNDSYSDEYKNYFYVDQSVATLNSPDLDFDENIKNVDLSQYKMRIVGYIPFNANYGSYNIVADGTLFKNTMKSGTGTDTEYIRGLYKPTGFYNYNYKKNGFWPDNNWCAGSQIYCASNCWLDDINGIFLHNGKNETGWNDKAYEVSYYVYPWNKEYLNNYNQNQIITKELSTQPDNITIDDINVSKTIRKVLANTKFSKATVFTEIINLDTDTIKFVDRQDKHVVRMSPTMIYKGFGDDLLTYDSEYVDNAFSGEQITGSNYGFEVGVVRGYPIMTGSHMWGVGWAKSIQALIDLSIPRKMSSAGRNDQGYKWYYTPNCSSTQPIMMRYESANHIVFNLSNSEVTIQQENNGQVEDVIKIAQNILPSKQGSVYSIDGDDQIDEGYIIKQLDHEYVWESDSENPVSLVRQRQVLTGDFQGYSNEYGYLWLGELYKPDENNPYVNDDEFNDKDRVWVPCGEEKQLSSDSSEYICFTEGDTYYQRYDCLKTSPYSSDDQQSVVEIASFMVETHINIDGRYDQNRGLFDNTFVNPTNFNLINPVYSQTNNFFQYNILDEEDFKTTDFPTRFTWSLNKINGQDIDEWTRTNTSAFYDCDGDKGAITSMRRFNDQIYAFQQKGISRIKYNENVAINTNNGTPIELGNSQSVNGVEYISELIGSQNKHSNISTPNGIFFTDNYTPGIYRLGGGERILTNLTKNTMQRWFESNNTNHNFINTASYDANMNEVHFMYDGGSLVYNNDFGVFTSFYDYTGWIGNIRNHSFNIHNDSIYYLREGEGYNTFYDNESTSPYWIEFVANSNIDGYSPSNAIFDNVWYKADSLNEDNTTNMNYNELIETRNEVIPNYEDNDGSSWYETFNKIECGNDYQYGMYQSGSDSHTQTKNFKFIKKFRTWRVPVPRNQIGVSSGNLHRDRMRNSWLRIKLTNTAPSTQKMVLRDIYVDSFF